jgi:phage terminase small subunit
VAKTPEEIAEKHRIFANAIMEGANQSDAARAAGYHPTNATQVMRSEDVQLALAEARQQITEATTIKRLDVLNIMIEAVDMARTLADPATMIKGASEIGKMMGYYEPEKLNINVNLDENVFHSKLKQLSDAELLEIASGRARVVEGEVLQ